MKKVVKVAGYVRVSTEEQRDYGYSIAAQIEKLKNWCKEKEYQLVGMYVDEGFSATNMKRPDLKRLLDNLEEIDIIVFTRLDRLSRNVLEANKMLDMFETHKVSMISIEEDDIDTTSADGMFMFQLKASLAERETKKTRERIRSVFDYKVKQGQAITGAVPFGYTIEKIDGVKKVVMDPNTEHIVRDIFSHFKTYQSIKKTTIDINEKYNLTRSYKSYCSILKREDYFTGSYRDNENYCPAYITKEEYLLNQEIIKKNIKVKKNSHIYIFSGLMKCPKCNRKLVGTYSKNSRRTPAKIVYRYKCNGYLSSKSCEFSKAVPQITLEKWLLDNIEDEINSYIEISNVKKINIEDPSKKIKELKREMENLNYMFRKDRIPASQYDYEYGILEDKLKKLKAVPTEKIDTTRLKELLNSGWLNIYNNLTKENKRVFWRNIIDEIVIDEDINYKIAFKRQ